MIYIPDYEYVKCDYCGGTIGNYDDDKFICGRCGKFVRFIRMGGEYQ